MRVQAVLKTNKLRVSLVVIAVLLLLTNILVLPVRAEEAGGQGIQVSPVLIDLNADKGNNYTLKLTVTNVTAGSLALKSTIEDFRAKDETGEPKIITDPNDVQETFSMKSWVSRIPSFTLKSKESRQINATVQIPENAEVGGHYGVIRFSGVPPELQDANLALSASVGVLLLARVGGDSIRESIVIKNFDANRNSKNGSLFKSSPVSYVERLQNNGNIHVKPTGNIVVKSIFGSVVDTVVVNEPPKNVLPNSIRKFTQLSTKSLPPGRYVASLNLTYGTNAGTISAETTFWVIPYQLIIGTFGLLMLVLLLGRIWLKKHNQKVIKRHSKRLK